MRSSCIFALLFLFLAALQCAIAGVTVGVQQSALSGGQEWFVETGGSGDGSPGDPFGQIQAALDAADPGDVVTVSAGTYFESLTTVRGGASTAPILVRAASGAEVVIESVGRVLTVEHPYHVFEGLTLDGAWGPADLVKIEDGADFTVLRNSEVRRSSRDCVDLRSVQGVLIEGSLIHHCLNATDGRTDAHGIVGRSVRDLVVRATEIHTFSGDAVQFDPSRLSPGWDNITIDGCLFWLAPLEETENGFAAGIVPGENAVDTKTWNDAARARLVIRNTVAFGFRNGLIPRMAAFNLKENVDVSIDAVTVFDSEIAFRLRGPTVERPAGAWVRIQNAMVRDVDQAFRYEKDIANLRIFNSTIGENVNEAFHAALAPNSVVDARNLLILGSVLPQEASGPSNLAVGAGSFRNVARNDYRLTRHSPAVDGGEPVDGVDADRWNIPRPQGVALDIGAFEFYRVTRRVPRYPTFPRVPR